jgi:site-specific DNA recombinase
MKKGIIYVRVSSTDQTQGTSLDSQERACLEYAERNGIEVIKTFIEKGESATAATRTEFLKALEVCRSRSEEITAFIVWKIDRFARNTTDHFAVRAKLTKYGIALISVTEPITQDHMGKLMETFLAGYAEFENEVRKQRCTAGIQARLSEGIWCWSPPIGYTNSKRIKDRRKIAPDVPDEERFYLIQRGLRLYKNGNHTITSLAKESQKWGLVTRTQKPMSKQLWERILVDKFYAGIIVDPWSGKEFNGQHVPMISRGEYEELQDVKRKLSNNANKPRPISNPDFPLRRFVYCKCGKLYTASWSKGRSKKYPIYHCKNKTCIEFGHTIPKDVIENSFCEFLRNVSPAPGFLGAFKQTVAECHQEKCKVARQEKLSHQREISRLETRRSSIIEMKVSQLISVEEYKDMKTMVDNQIARLKLTDGMFDENIELRKALDYTVKFLTDISHKWKMVALLHKLRIQRVVLPQGITYLKESRQFGTAILSPIFKLNEAFLYNPSDLVAEVGRNWHQILASIKQINELEPGE